MDFVIQLAIVLACLFYGARKGGVALGKYVINHSFIPPVLIGVSTSCVVGYCIATARGLV
jgi:anaerobic C4-dicarboxylate transporter DcuB